ncbi:MAG: hypothetical protein IPP83_16120 [Flavobacteriales bacterium]|nr:hypothetical protein [Flavobacteriales bacterium]
MATRRARTPVGNRPRHRESGDPDDVATEENSEVEVVKPPTPKPNPKPVKKPSTEKPKEPAIDSRLSNALNNWNKPGQTPSDGPGRILVTRVSLMGSPVVPV